MADRYILINSRVRGNAMAAVERAPDGYTVTVSEPIRSTDQNAKFHAIVADIARSPLKWAGKHRTPEQWKAILISGHAVATKEPGEVIPGIEGEFVAIRESSARMSVRRASSLIEYTLAFCATHGIELIETRRRGFMDERTAA
jgi:hypothetical protein